MEFHLSTNSSFYCLAERHNPQPVDQVGEIKPTSPNSNQIKTNVYQLLNPDHSDEVFFVVNMPSDLKVTARSEGLQIKREVVQKSKFVEYAFGATIGISLAVLVSVFGWFGKRISTVSRKLDKNRELLETTFRQAMDIHDRALEAEKKMEKAFNDPMAKIQVDAALGAIDRKAKERQGENKQKAQKSERKDA